MRRRSVPDLLRELETEPGQAALVLVWSDGTCARIHAHDSNRRLALETALGEGASPVGFVRRGADGWSSRILCEYAGDSAVENLLLSLHQGRFDP
jgi:streptomycin 6-kinase